MLETKISADHSNGRPSIDLWRILVFGTLRLVINSDYDRLQELANEHGTLRQMLGHGPYCIHFYTIQTLQDNICLFTPEILDQANQIVVAAGHLLVKTGMAKAFLTCCTTVEIKVLRLHSTA
ncbi:hypothetical protein [Parendozoicomonas callyspongiae]|uniref:hypothetical protein n=1 Tax=Parendozoicomonas callyspongiae TaxID=2942213 RepID=UPI0038CD5232